MPKKKKSKEKRYLSASRMKAMELCSWSYWCKYHLGLPDKTNEGALRGSICHLILELLLKPRHKKHYDSILKKKAIKISKPVDKTVIKFLKANGIYNKENYDLCSKMIYVALDHDFFGTDGAFIDHPEQEFKIESKDPKYNIYGYIDKPIQYKKDEMLHIVDYKTSKQKFRGEELESNVQAMMYSLAAKKLWPQLKRRKVQFLFLKFPRAPLQELEYSNEELKGFEYYLEKVSKIVDEYTEETAKSSYAPANGNGWLCGPAKSGWICPFHKPFDYYVLLDKDGERIKSSYENDFETKKGQTVEKRRYDGCPAKNVKVNNDNEEDLFDF
jgi:ATP-dependent helicase/DNAse subunit B